jgi:hypothetical protein
VFVALIAVLYQGDLALGTENYALLAIGKWAAFGWFALFVVKLRALAWALRLKLSTSAFAVASFGAAGIAVVPQLSRTLGSRALSSVVALWLLALFASALWTSRVVTSERGLDAWGEKVLARSLRATWSIWGGLAFGHVLFWTWRYHLDARIFAPIALLLATRWIEQETRLVAAVVATLSFAFVCAPSLLPLTALLCALVLALHALRKPHDPREPEATEPPRDDYRAATAEEERPRRPTTFAPLPQPLFARHLAWASYALYLSAWTLAWRGGALPNHVVALDLCVAPIVALFVWWSRSRLVTLPLIASYLHWSIQSRLLRAPQSSLEWGTSTFALGFLLLLASLFASFRLERPLRSD